MARLGIFILGVMGLATVTATISLGTTPPEAINDFEWSTVPKYEPAPSPGIWDKLKKGKKWSWIPSWPWKNKDDVHHETSTRYPIWKIHKYKGIEIRPVKVVEFPKYVKHEGIHHEISSPVYHSEGHPVVHEASSPAHHFDSHHEFYSPVDHSESHQEASSPLYHSSHHEASLGHQSNSPLEVSSPVYHSENHPIHQIGSHHEVSSPVHHSENHHEVFSPVYHSESHPSYQIESHHEVSSPVYHSESLPSYQIESHHEVSSPVHHSDSHHQVLSPVYHHEKYELPSEEAQTQVYHHHHHHAKVIPVPVHHHEVQNEEHHEVDNHISPQFGGPHLPNLNIPEAERSLLSSFIGEGHSIATLQKLMPIIQKDKHLLKKLSQLHGFQSSWAPKVAHEEEILVSEKQPKTLFAFFPSIFGGPSKSEHHEHVLGPQEHVFQGPQVHSHESFTGLPEVEDAYIPGFNHLQLPNVPEIYGAIPVHVPSHQTVTTTVVENIRPHSEPKLTTQIAKEENNQYEQPIHQQYAENYPPYPVQGDKQLYNSYGEPISSDSYSSPSENVEVAVTTVSQQQNNEVGVTIPKTAETTQQDLGSQQERQQVSSHLDLSQSPE